MKVYKVRAWTISPKGELDNVCEEVYIGLKNKKMALDEGKRAISNNKSSEFYGYTLRVEVFEPKVWNDGKLAHFPENDGSDDSYLLKYETGK